MKKGLLMVVVVGLSSLSQGAIDVSWMVPLQAAFTDIDSPITTIVTTAAIVAVGWWAVVMFIGRARSALSAGSGGSDGGDPEYENPCAASEDDGDEDWED